MCLMHFIYLGLYYILCWKSPIKSKRSIFLSLYMCPSNIQLGKLQWKFDWSLELLKYFDIIPSYKKKAYLNSLKLLFSKSVCEKWHIELKIHSFKKPEIEGEKNQCPW